MRKINFTLIEVVMALAILTLILLTALSICSFSKTRIDKAQRKWQTQNMLSQASEYSLLTGETNIPEKFFPFKNYKANISVSTCNKLPAGVSCYNGNWYLATCHISITSNGKFLKDVKIDKILKK